ncbi:MAG: hypothetical protein ACTSRI_02030 [Promethearchaeota archaeon]
MASKLKRLPNHSFTIILKFDKREDRNECIHSEKFKKVYSRLASLLIANYNCSIENIIYPP